MSRENQDRILDDLYTFAESEVKEALKNSNPYDFEKWSRVVVLLLKHSEEAS